MRIVTSPFRAIRQIVSFPVDLTNDFLTLKGHYLAAAISFYAFLSLFPLTIALITLLHLTLGKTRLDTVIVENLIEQIPVLAAASGPSFIESFVTDAASRPAVTSSISGLILCVSALGVFGAIRESINIMWGLRRRPSFFKQKCTEAALMVGASLLLFTSLVVSAFYSFLNELSRLIWEDSQAVNGWFFDAAGVAMPLGISFIVFISLYRWLPQTNVEVKDIVPISLIVAVAFELAKFAFIYYLQNGAERFLTVYGSVSTLMMFFTFIYVQSIILLAGAMLCGKWTAYLRMRRARSRGAAKR